MSDTARIGRNPDFVHRRVGEEEILVPVRRIGGEVSSLYLLNPVASEIWAALERPRTRAELVSHVMDRFDVDGETAATDLDAFLGELRSVGALAEGDGP